MYITYEIGIGGNYSKTSLKLLFHVATNNPALFSLREGTQYYGFNANWISLRMLGHRCKLILRYLNLTVWLVTFCGSFISVTFPIKQETKQKKSKKLRVQTIFLLFLLNFHFVLLLSPSICSDCPGKIISQS